MCGCLEAETEEVVSKDVGLKEVLSKVTSDGPGVEASVPPFSRGTMWT